MYLQTWPNQKVNVWQPYKRASIVQTRDGRLTRRSGVKLKFSFLRAAVTTWSVSTLKSEDAFFSFQQNGSTDSGIISRRSRYLILVLEMPSETLVSILSLVSTNLNPPGEDRPQTRIVTIVPLLSVRYCIKEYTKHLPQALFLISLSRQWVPVYEIFANYHWSIS